MKKKSINSPLTKQKKKMDNCLNKNLSINISSLPSYLFYPFPNSKLTQRLPWKSTNLSPLLPWISSKNQLGGSVDRWEGSTDARCAGLPGGERETGGRRERNGGWRSRGGPAAEQIPGLIDGTTGALDFPRVARAFPSFPLTPRSHPHPPSRLSSVTHDPGAVVHPSGCGKAQEGPGRATREQLCHWAVVRVTWPRDFLPSVLHGAALPAVISATSHQFNPRGGEDISSPRVRDIFFGDFFSLPRKGVCVCVCVRPLAVSSLYLE